MTPKSAVKGETTMTSKAAVEGETAMTSHPAMAGHATPSWCCSACGKHRG